MRSHPCSSNLRPERRHVHARRGQAAGRQERLACGVALRDLNSFKSIVADDATPNRVVEVEHEASAALAAHRPNDPADVIRVERNVIIGKWQFRQIPLCGGMPVCKASRFSNACNVEEQIA